MQYIQTLKLSKKTYTDLFHMNPREKYANKAIQKNIYFFLWTLLMG